MKVLIVFDTKYGNTQKVAELIAEGGRSGDRNEVEVKNVKDVDLSKEESYDLILIGSPNHMGAHTESVKKFIKKFSKAHLKAKSFAVFDTYLKKDAEIAVNKMEKQIMKIMPNLKKASSGLSIKVGGMKGPILNVELQKCREFGIKLLD